MVAILAKEKCIISPDWEGVIEGGFEQSFSRVSLFEIARNLSMYWRENLNFEMYNVAAIPIIFSWRDPCNKDINKHNDKSQQASADDGIHMEVYPLLAVLK